MILDWFRRTVRWHPLERELILALANRMPAAAGELARKQLDAVTLAQRHDKGTEVCLYRLERGVVAWPDALRFPNRHPELRVASMRFVAEGEEATRSVTFHAVEGILFSLTFDRTPPKASDRSLGSVVDVQWYADLLDPSSPPAARPSDVVFPADYPPASDDAFFNGLAGRGVVVNAPDAVRSIPTEEGAFEVLAEIHDVGVLAVKQGAGSAVWLLRYGGGPAERLSESFQMAISQAMTTRQ